MNSAIGGTATAAGIGFQYLATIEALLDRLEETPGDFTLTTEDPRGEILDFSIDIEGEMFLAAQAKAAVDGPDGARHRAVHRGSRGRAGDRIRLPHRTAAARTARGRGAAAAGGAALRRGVRDDLSRP